LGLEKHSKQASIFNAPVIGTMQQVSIIFQILNGNDHPIDVWLGSQ
jgi:hypothetical protein